MDVKEAVQAAVNFVAEMFSTGKDLRLEEVEMSDEGPWWDITLSFPHPPDTAIEAVIGGPKRSYKIVRVNRVTGEIHSAKIRKV